MSNLEIVIPEKDVVQNQYGFGKRVFCPESRAGVYGWIPAYAGMTRKEWK